jgi:hypothetical protein
MICHALQLLNQQLDILQDGLLTRRPIKATLLWGPPGSGKTSIAHTFSGSERGGYFINNDKIMEVLLRIWFNDIHREIQAGMPEEEKEDCFWEVRNMQFDDLGLPEKEVMQTLLKALNMQEFTEDEFSAFKLTSDEPVIMYCAVAFLIFLAKQRHCDFIQETTGNSFSAQRTRKVFENTHSKLQVVYVSSLATLYRRVGSRTAQLLNAPRQYIKDSYYKSYYNNIRMALQSGIFIEIVITSNDRSPSTTMLSLTKQVSGKPGYHMLGSPTGRMNRAEAAFVGRVLSALGLPEMALHESRPLHAFFCSLTHTWTLI